MELQYMRTNFAVPRTRTRSCVRRALRLNFATSRQTAVRFRVSEFSGGGSGVCACLPLRLRD
eukprot:scaffold35099_cov27-Prasinocladus_malaysianus.AAC.1